VSKLFTKILPYGLIALIALALYWWLYDMGYDAGYDKRSVECQQTITETKALRDKALATNAEVYERIKNEAVESEREYWKNNQETEVRYETIEKEVIRYIGADNDSSCSVDDDFMLIWRSANANRDNQ